MADFAVRGCIKGLIVHLKANMPSLKQAYDDWPNPNQKLEYPCLSIFSRNPSYMGVNPYVISKGDPIISGPDEDKVPVRTVIGMWDFKFQIDLWADSKPTRAKIEKELMAAFSKDRSTSGVNLQLTDYFSEWVHFDLADFAYADTEEGSQRSEWRVKVDVLANCREIIETNEFIIETIENNLETPNTIPSSPEDGGTSII